MTSRKVKAPPVNLKKAIKQLYRKLHPGRKTPQFTPNPSQNDVIHQNQRPRPEIRGSSSNHPETERSTGVTLPDGESQFHQPNALGIREPPPRVQAANSSEPIPLPPANKNWSNVGQGVDLKKGDPSPSELEGPIPASVPCKLFVFLDGKIFPHFEEARCYWNDNSYFNILQNAADRILKEQGDIHPEDESARLYRRAGQCRLVRREDDFEVESIIIENERQWAQFLPLMVAKFAANNPFVPFYLDFRWEYSLLIIKRQDGVAYAETVKGVLYEHRKRNHRNQKYIPRQVLDNLFKPSTVRELIDQDESLKRLEQKLRSETGQLLNKEKFMDHVIANGIVYLALCIYAGLPLECLYRLTEKYEDCTTLLQVSDCPNDISKPLFDHLVELQGGFRAHTFPIDRGAPEHQKLDDSIVVPIKFDEEKDLVGSGGFGDVFRVHIDPDHHRFSPDRDTVYALKRFHSRKGTEIYFEKELRALSALARVPHPNITLHLASWTQDGLFYMLFPYAESNLQSHLLQKSAPELNKEFVLFLLTQLRDLAAAVEHIHSLNLASSIQKPENVAQNSGGNLRVVTGQKYKHIGFHYDLKPSNILIFQSEKKADPIWRVSDFGTAQINEILLSGSQQLTDTTRVEESTVGDPEYSAPDLALQGWSSRPYDIWSMGCIYLQVLLWTFDYGGQHLRDFQVQRLTTSDSQSNQSPAFWYRDRNSKVKLKPAVVTKLKDLKACCQNRGVFDNLYRLTANMLTVVPKERPEASQVRSEINTLRIQAENDLQNPGFYKNGLHDREVIAKPATAVRSPSRAESIDLRSVTASPVTPDRGDPLRLGLGEYRRSFSKPSRKVELLDAREHGGAEFIGNHLDNGELSMQRSRSPSISTVTPEGTAQLHLDSDFGSHPPMLSYNNIVRNQDI